MSRFNVDYVYCSPSQERWVFQLFGNTVKVFCQGERREYTIDGEIFSTEQNDQYITIHTKVDGETFLNQFKFEDNFFLVGDVFYLNGEHKESFASHVFGEDDNKRKVISSMLRITFCQIGMDNPNNIDEIVDFIVDDVNDCADPKDWHTGDVIIGLRRWIESQSTN